MELHNLNSQNYLSFLENYYIKLIYFLNLYAFLTLISINTSYGEDVPEIVEVQKVTRGSSLLSPVNSGRTPKSLPGAPTRPGGVGMPQTGSNNKVLPVTKRRSPASTATHYFEESPFYLLPELGLNTLNYSETGISTYTAVLVTAKLGINLNLVPKHLNLYGSVTYSGFGQFASTPAISANMTWLNTGGSYTFNMSFLHGGFKIGWYYGGMSVTDSQFGIDGLYGFNVSPFIAIDFGPTMTLGSYYKYGPALGTSSLSNTSNAMGLVWTKKYSNRESLRINFDYSTINLVVGKSTVSLSSLGLSLSYSGFAWEF
ncbi:MAG: hypothetical protein ABI041_02155 [Bdellovibrionia bacterium]